jgi:hypothetical protein
MKSLVAILLMLLFVGAGKAQNAVSWNFTAKKIADKTYEVHLTATVAKSWRIYSQTTPDGGPVKTSIVFNKNPLSSFVGKIKEEGRLKQKHEDVFGVDVKYYENKVDFIQMIKLKSNVKTSILGTVEYMACNDQQCLPPKKEKFSIKIE